MAAFDARSLSRGLIGGMELPQFNGDIRERRAARFAGAISAADLDRLLTVSRLESLIASEAVPMHAIDIFDEGFLRRLTDVQMKSGKSAVTIVTDTFRQGSTIRVRDLDAVDPSMAALVREVQRYFAARSQVNLYLTPPSKGGFPPHFDITDVFIVQCAGKKEWRVFEDYSNRTELPLRETNWDPDRFTPSGGFEQMTLSAGDVLYLPRGVMHQAYCTDRESMHLTISIVPMTFADLIARALHRVSEGDVEFRRRVPWSIDAGRESHDEVGARVRECVMTLAGRIDVEPLLLEERRSLVGEPEVRSTGALQSAIASLLGATRGDASGG